MGLVNRWYSILNLFLTHGSLSLEDLELNLEISTRTIKNSINLLNNEMEEIASIDFKGSLYYLSIDDYDGFDRIMAGQLKVDSDFNSSSKRNAYILKRLLDLNDFLLIADFAEDLDVSRGTVNNDLKNIRQQLEKFNVEIISAPNRGIRIKGSELNLRLVYLHLVQDYFESKHIKTSTIIFLEALEEKYSLSKESSNLLIKVIEIILNRISHSYHLEETIDGYINYLESDSIFDELVFHVETEYSISLNYNEKDFLSFPLTLSDIFKKYRLEFYDNNILRLAYQKMMKAINETFIVDLDMASFYDEIYSHLMGLIQRARFNIIPKNIFYGEIENKYPFSYALAKVSVGEISKVLQVQINPVEIDYLALYFELVNRDAEKDNNRIAIVCNTGKGTSGMIRRQIERIIGNDINITQFSEEEYLEEDLSKYFAIFTTIPLRELDKNIPIISISNIFDDEQLNKEWRRVVGSKASLRKTIRFKFVRLDNLTTYDAVLKFITSRLQLKGLIDDDFYDQIIKREKQRTTIYNPGFAFPHAINHKSNEIMLIVGTSQESIVTEHGLVHIVFMLVIPEKMTKIQESDLLDLYDGIFRIVGNEDLINEIKSIQNENDFKKLIIERGMLG